jgi:hypothetical protein
MDGWLASCVSFHDINVPGLGNGKCFIGKTLANFFDEA